jgi:hypothetical protein
LARPKDYTEAEIAAGTLTIEKADLTVEDVTEFFEYTKKGEQTINLAELVPGARSYTPDVFTNDNGIVSGDITIDATGLMKFALSELTKDNIELIDIAAIRVMQFAWDCKKIFEVSANQKGCIIVVDRLHLSNYIYGYLLRKERFESIWGVSGALLLEVNKAFEETAQSFCDVKLLTFVKSNDSEDYADDNLHEIVSVTVGQQVLANEYFEWLHTESNIIDKQLTILAVKDSNGLYPTLDYMLRSVKSLLQK